MLNPLDAIITAVLICLGLYYYLEKKHSYWADRGIPFVKPEFFFGNTKTMNRTEQPGKLFQRFYNELKGQHPFGGIYMFTSPVAIITDMELLKCVFVKDFQYFHDRGHYSDEKNDPLTAHMFNLNGIRWKNLRNKLSPAFTSGKMKLMFPTFVAAIEQFNDFIYEKVEHESEFELRDLLARYTTDVIGMCAFGIECNSMKDPDAEFRVMGRKIFEIPRSKLKVFLTTNMPAVARFLRVKMVHPDVHNFFINVVRETIDFRLKHNVKRNDFMDLLIQLRNPDETSNNEELLSFNEIAAQAFLFYMGGFETSSTLLTWALYELALNQDIQEKGRQHVQEVLAQHNGEITYESVTAMRYLDQILQESLRKYPPIPAHLRETTKDYQVPNTKTVLAAGTKIFIPVYGIHHDPELFPDPDRFDPDRFDPEQDTKRDRYTFTPFGEGPRICIGVRFGMMQARVGLVHLLANFRFSIGSKCQVPLQFNAKSFILAPRDGLWLKVQKL